MRLANRAGRAVLLSADDELALDVADASLGRFLPTPMSLFSRWLEFKEWAATANFARAQRFERNSLCAPVPQPPQVFAIGMNYRSHVLETGRAAPQEPMVFTKFPSCICGPYDRITIDSATVDWEVESVVVVGVGGFRISQEKAWEHVAGITVGQDLSDRLIQHRPHEDPRQFSLGKSLPGFGPIGPVVLSPDEFSDPDDIGLSCHIGDEQLQIGRTSDLIFSVPQLIASLSGIVRLLPGDLVFTGTPGGIGGKRKPPRYLAPGQVLETRMEGVGSMFNPIQAA